MERLFILTLQRLGAIVTEQPESRTIKVEGADFYLKAKALAVETFGAKQVGFSMPDPANWYIKNGHHDNAMYIYL